MTTTFKYKEDGNESIKDEITGENILDRVVVSTPNGLEKITTYTKNYTFDKKNSLETIENIVNINGLISTAVRGLKTSTTKITSAEGREVEISYDKKTLLAIKIDMAKLKPIHYQYDQLGKTTQITQGEKTVKFIYDEFGNMAELRNLHKNQITKYEYDLLERVTKITYPNGNFAEFEYDKNGNMVKVVTPTPTEYIFDYNGVDKKTSYNSPLNFKTLYSYDKQKRVTKVTKPSGKMIDINYDRGRINNISTVEGVTNFGYGCGDKITSISKNGEAISFNYDGNLITNISLSGVLNQTISLTYNNFFAPISINYANQTTTFGYDKDGLLTQNGNFQITRDLQTGFVSKVTDGSMLVEFDYNSYGELTNKKESLRNSKLICFRYNTHIERLPVIYHHETEATSFSLNEKTS